jgi:hypothetical protein
MTNPNPYAPGREPGGYLRWREGTTTTTTTARHALVALTNYASARVAEAHRLRAHVNRLIGRS